MTRSDYHQGITEHKVLNLIAIKNNINIKTNKNVFFFLVLIRFQEHAITMYTNFSGEIVHRSTRFIYLFQLNFICKLTNLYSALRQFASYKKIKKVSEAP